MKKTTLNLNKSIALIALLITFTTHSFAQWDPPGANQFQDIHRWGKVGIGSLFPPTMNLEVEGDVVFKYAGLNEVGFWQPNGEAGMALKKNGNTRADVRFDGNRLGLFVNASGTNPPTEGMVIDGNGNVGIGTYSPGMDLDVDGDVRFKYGGYNEVGFWQPNGEAGIALLRNNSSRADVRFDGGRLGLFVSPSAITPPTEGIVIDGNGKVGIGNPTPSYKLNVNDNSNSDYGSWISANSKGPALFVRRDGISGNYTGHTSYTAGTRYAMRVENYDNEEDNGGGWFEAYNIGVRADARPRIEGGSAIGIDASARSYYSNAILQQAEGVIAAASKAQNAWGVEGFGYGTSQGMGVQAIASIDGTGGGTTRAYGIYGGLDPASTAGFQYAGYFAGNTLCGSTFFSSDEKLKQNIKPISNSLELITKLAPKSYEFKQDDEFLGFAFDKGKKYGLIAQELEKILPELVKTAYNPEIKNSDGRIISKAFDFKAIDYVSLVPLLIGGIKEQQQQIASRDAEIAELKKGFTELQAAVNELKQSVSICCTQASHSDNSKTDKPTLDQNVPNPLNNTTSIGYYLPQSTQAATLVIVNMEGKIMFTQNLTKAGRGNMEINTTLWASGIYTYQLTVNGNAVDAKRMVITR
jgi:hypothetical protein